MSSIGYSNISTSEIDSLIPSASNKASEFYTSPGLRFRGLDRVDQGANWFQANSNFRTGLKKLSDFAGYYKFEGMRFGYLYNFHALTSLGKTIGPPGTNWRPPDSLAELRGMFASDPIPDIIEEDYGYMAAQGTYEEGGYPRNEPATLNDPHFDVSRYCSGYTYYPSEGIYMPRTLNLILSGVRHHSRGTDGNRGTEGRWWCSAEKDLVDGYAMKWKYEPSSVYPNLLITIREFGYNRKNDGCSLRLINSNASDVAAWQKGDTITIEGLIYNIELNSDGTKLYLVQNYAGTKYTDGTDIPFYDGSASEWDNSDPKMCAYFDQNDLAVYTNHF